MIDREFVTQAAIALSVCLGSWMLYVKPKTSALAEMETRLEQFRTKAAALNTATVEQVAAQAPRLAERTREIENRGDLAKDTSVLYGQIMSLAKAHDVQVKNLRPGSERRAGEGDALSITRIDMTVNGRYSRIAEFLEAVDDIDAYLRLVSVQMAPTKKDGRNWTMMQLGFEALQFRLPRIVRKTKNGDR